MNKNKLSNQIMKKIQKGDVKMTSKYLFIAKTLGLQTAFGLTIIIALLSLNFALYLFTNSEAFLTYRPGYPGFKLLLTSFPYAYAIVAIVMLTSLNIIWKQFDVSYKDKYKYAFTILVTTVIVGGFLLLHSNLHEIIQKRFSHRPFMQRMYLHRMLHSTPKTQSEMPRMKRLDIK